MFIQDRSNFRFREKKMNFGLRMVTGTGLVLKTGTRTAQPNLQILKLYPSYDEDGCIMIHEHVCPCIDTVKFYSFIKHSKNMEFLTNRK